MSKATFFRLHSWLGIVTGVFMVAIAWSGSLVVFNDEIEWLVNPDVRADPSLTTQPLDQIVGAVQDRYPGRRLAVHFQIGPNWAHTAFVYEARSTRFVHIDPATALIRSDEVMDGYTWNIAYFLRQLHIRLLMGYWGRVFVGVFGVTLVLSVATSLWIYRDWIRSALRIRRDSGRRVFHMDLHKAIGLWSLAFNLMFGITGAILGLENLYYRVWPRTPEQLVATEIEGPRAPADLTPSGIIAYLEKTDRQFRPTSIELPIDGPIVVRGDHPGALIAEGASAYAIVPATGAVTATVDARRANWPTYLYNVLDPLHFGYFGERWGFITGYVIEVLWCVTGLAPGALGITGGMMWLLRRRRQRAARAARVALADISPQPRY